MGGGVDMTKEFIPAAAVGRLHRSQEFPEVTAVVQA